MNYLYGRYALGCMWARSIAGIAVKGNAFVPQTVYMPYEEADLEIVSTIQELADAVG